MPKITAVTEEARPKTVQHTCASLDDIRGRPKAHAREESIRKKKPAQGDDRLRSRIDLPPTVVRRKIWEQAIALVAVAEDRDICVVLASRFQVPEEVIERVLAMEGLRHEREAIVLCHGICNALHLARVANASLTTILTLGEEEDINSSSRHAKPPAAERSIC